MRNDKVEAPKIDSIVFSCLCLYVSKGKGKEMGTPFDSLADVLKHNVIPQLDAKDVLCLAATCKDLSHTLKGDVEHVSKPSITTLCMLRNMIHTVNELRSLKSFPKYDAAVVFHIFPERSITLYIPKLNEGTILIQAVDDHQKCVFRGGDIDDPLLLTVLERWLTFSKEVVSLRSSDAYSQTQMSNYIVTKLRDDDHRRLMIEGFQLFTFVTVPELLGKQYVRVESYRSLI